jgi:IMP dehydrogenase
VSETLTAQSDFDVPKGDKDELFALLSAEKRHVGYPMIDMLTENVNDIDFSEVDFSVDLTPEVKMPLPILGAAMNTVAGTESAKAAGRQGAGMILPHANTPAEQKKMVREVKLDLSGVIDEPRVAYADETIEKLLNREGHHHFRTFPVIDSDGKYVGLVTKQLINLFSKNGADTPINQVMAPAAAEQIVPEDTGTSQAYEYMCERKSSNGKLVRLNENGEVTGLFLEPDVMRQVQGNPDRYLIGNDGRYVTFASVSPNPKSACERVDLMRDYLDYVVINTSHGENMRTFNTLSALQNLIRTINHDYGKRIGVIAGNISTWQTAQALAGAGPAGVIIGQGPGSACDSHNRLGYGTAQATAVYECAPAIKEVDPKIFAIADGAIREPADAIKAFGLGADMLIAGGLFAATDEAPMPLVRMPDGSGLGKEYYGMGSEKAQREFLAARERYGHFDGAYTGVIFSEGKEMILPLKGPIAKVLGEFALGMRISMGSMGFRDIRNLRHGMSLRRG